MNIMTLCPTRARPVRLATMLHSFLANRNEGTEIVFYIADDDPKMDGYKAMNLERIGHVLTGPRLDISTAFNVMFQKFPDYDYYSITNDDYVYRTHSWDKILSEAIDKRCGFWGIANANELTFQRDYEVHRHPSGCVISGNIPRTLGHIYHPSINSYRNDTYLRDLVEQIGPAPTSHYVFLPEVVIEHVHFSNGKAAHDATYQIQYDPAHRVAGDAKYEFWRQNYMPSDMATLRKAITQDAYSRGYNRSYQSNNGRCSNPYPAGTNEHAEWLRGFDYCKCSVE